MKNMLPLLTRIFHASVAHSQAAEAIKERNKTSRIQLAPPPTLSQYTEKMYGKGTKYSDLSSKQKSNLTKDYAKSMEQIEYMDSSKQTPNRFYKGFEQSVLPQGYFQGNKRRYKRGGLVIPETEANPTFQGKLQPFSHPMERRQRVSKFSINTDSDEKTRHPLDKKLYRHAFTAQIKMEEAHEKAKNAIEERNKITRVQLAPPKTFDQFRESMYGEGVRTKDLSSGQQKRLRGDYIKAMEEIAYVDSGKQSNRFYREYDQSVLPQGYFQGNKRRYKTGGLVIAQEETNSNKPRGARKELKGTKFKGVF
jgi:hypothetical protein